MLKIRELFILIICGKIGAVRTSAHLKTFSNLNAFVDGKVNEKVVHRVESFAMFAQTFCSAKHYEKSFEGNKSFED